MCFTAQIFKRERPLSALVCVCTRRKIPTQRALISAIFIKVRPLEFNMIKCTLILLPLLIFSLYIFHYLTYICSISAWHTTWLLSFICFVFFGQYKYHSISGFYSLAFRYIHLYLSFESVSHTFRILRSN